MPSSSSSSSSSSSPLEKSCFVCHLFMIPITILVGIWIIAAPPSSHNLDTTVGYLQLPHPSYVIHIPVSLLAFFLAAPILYTFFNSLTVPPLECNNNSDNNSLDVLQDQYTKRQQPQQQHLQQQFGRSSQEALPEICDLDPATLVWYYNNSED